MTRSQVQVLDRPPLFEKSSFYLSGIIPIMSSKSLYEVIIPTDRWHIRAVSPVDIRDERIRDSYSLAVIIHPGWAKSPERHRLLLKELLSIGVLPIGVDTRYGYADRAQRHTGNRRFTRLLSQSYRVGVSNPYFQVKTSAHNRWLLRRPTALLHLCETLKLGPRIYIGHSEGARIVSLAASASIDHTKGLIIVNGAGTGDSSNGVRRMVRSNLHGVLGLGRNESSAVDVILSAAGSVFYTITHARRTWHEKKVIQAADTWKLLNELADLKVPISVFHAKSDELISYLDSKENAHGDDRIGFYSTQGNHSNIFDAGVREQIVRQVQRYKDIAQQMK